jgi:hypothetical protein
MTDIFQPVSKKYFDSLKVRMFSKGFKLISQVEISQEETPFHIQANFAKETTLFFHLQNTSLLLQMTLYENDAFYQKHYWGIILHVQYKPFSILETLFPNLHNPESNLLLLPIYKYPLEIEGFKRHNSSSYIENYYQATQHYEQENTKIFLANTEQLVSNINFSVQQIQPFLDNSFQHLTTFSFWPHYSFPKSKQLFWKKFNIKNLKSITNPNLWSSFLERCVDEIL